MDSWTFDELVSLLTPSVVTESSISRDRQDFVLCEGVNSLNSDDMPDFSSLCAEKDSSNFSLVRDFLQVLDFWNILLNFGFLILPCVVEYYLSL